ncbi:25286_t:CDS:2, partial [Dentiscutata erythropus]
MNFHHGQSKFHSVQLVQNIGLYPESDLSTGEYCKRIVNEKIIEKLLAVAGIIIAA